MPPGLVRQSRRTRMYLTAAEHWEEVARAHGEVFANIRPA
jgi:hypothetical protein